MKNQGLFEILPRFGKPPAHSQENVDCALVDANSIFDFQISRNALIPRNCFPWTEMFFDLEKPHLFWNVIPARVLFSKLFSIDQNCFPK